MISAASGSSARMTIRPVALQHHVLPPSAVADESWIAGRCTGAVVRRQAIQARAVTSRTSLLAVTWTISLSRQAWHRRKRRVVPGRVDLVKRSDSESGAYATFFGLGDSTRQCVHRADSAA